MTETLVPALSSDAAPLPRGMAAGMAAPMADSLAAGVVPPGRLPPGEAVTTPQALAGIQGARPRPASPPIP